MAPSRIAPAPRQRDGARTTRRAITAWASIARVDLQLLEFRGSLTLALDLFDHRIRQEPGSEKLSTLAVHLRQSDFATGVNESHCGEVHEHLLAQKTDGDCSPRFLQFLNP